MWKLSNYSVVKLNFKSWHSSHKLYDSVILLMKGSFLLTSLTCNGGQKWYLPPKIVVKIR